ncbi:hypothetical protein Tco_0729799 [Tanacetum coccineum]|uniref:Uncharacterized protein n=1 Tax=Tanacetum coccineum TaxID=301880 RepID=A0ABQ4YPY8_9ASTR
MVTDLHLLHSKPVIPHLGRSLTLINTKKTSSKGLILKQKSSSVKVLQRQKVDMLPTNAEEKDKYRVGLGCWESSRLVRRWGAGGEQARGLARGRTCVIHQANQKDAYGLIRAEGHNAAVAFMATVTTSANCNPNKSSQ